MSDRAGAAAFKNLSRRLAEAARPAVGGPVGEVLDRVDVAVPIGREPRADPDLQFERTGVRCDDVVIPRQIVSRLLNLLAKCAMPSGWYGLGEARPARAARARTSSRSGRERSWRVRCEARWSCRSGSSGEWHVNSSECLLVASAVLQPTEALLVLPAEPCLGKRDLGGTTRAGEFSSLLGFGSVARLATRGAHRCRWRGVGCSHCGFVARGHERG